MKLDVYWTPTEVERAMLHDRVVVVIDVLRAATSVAVAIANGARAILPTESTEDALRLVRSLGRDETLLCGERQGVRIEGFDLGNSPAEFGPALVRNRILVMTTTNGTRALMTASGSRLAFVAAFVNLDAVARAVTALDEDVVILCAGRQGAVSADDALCAGLIVAESIELLGHLPVDLNDGALAALALARQHGTDLAAFLRRTEAGRALDQIGRAGDIEFCARRDTVPELPVLRDRQITRAADGALEDLASRGGAR